MSVAEGSGSAAERASPSAEFSSYMLHPIPKTSQDGSKQLKPSANIIAVAGNGAWEKEVWTSATHSFFWLEDGLMQDFSGCNVWGFGYKTYIAASDENVSLGLLTSLSIEFKGDELRSVPIIFLAAGLGGLIVKDALIRSSSSDQFRFVQSSTRAILFFGTPHRCDTNTLERLPAGPRWFTPKDAARVGDINDRFVHSAPRQKIACFYETIPTRKALILDRRSSTLDLAGSMNIALPATHSGLTKYQNKHDTSYKTVLRTLQDIDPSWRVQVQSETKDPKPDSPIPDPHNSNSLIPIPPPSLHFEARLQIFREDGTLQDQKAPKGYNIPLTYMKGDTKAEDSKLLWMHANLTDASWVQFCLRSLIFLLVGSDEGEIPIMNPRYWSDNERRNPSISHARYMEPGVHSTSAGSPSGNAVYLPYLHWDNYSAFEKRSKFISGCRRDPGTVVPEGLPETTRRLFQVIKDDINGPNSLHPRRSLDQYFYPHLSDTSFRDKDQVVWRRTKEARGGSKMIMVDQLWLWSIKYSNGKKAILTCFPEKEEEPVSTGLESDTDLYQAILNKLQSEETNVELERSSEYIGEYVASIIIERTVSKMLTYRDPSLDFLSIFRDAIGKVTDDTAKYFRDFRRALEKQTNGKPRELSNKKEEAKSVLEVLDIIDELNSISRLLRTQKDTLLNVERLGRMFSDRISEVRKHLDGYMDQVKRLNEDAERTRQSLMSLLDLQQQEESLDLARLAKEQADETEAQSRILMLFTIVTIVFLPLSFFTSYYGMNVRQLTGEEGNTSVGEVWKVMGPISFAIIVSLLGYAAMLYWKAKEKRESSNKGTDASGPNTPQKGDKTEGDGSNAPRGSKSGSRSSTEDEPTSEGGGNSRDSQRHTSPERGTNKRKRPAMFPWIANPVRGRKAGIRKRDEEQPPIKLERL
ncbi:hypothetical protein K458DRAFT_387567 [Lentithecium fluviatile CBS 122367]|uniref:Cora-domain-containing protein n=1 Tax=Lentithecium fluviatile CBS 122367 TaxID=1168545 RepID=A0A6G1J507_9PLEO|nr:hypothetical protein K458DRAFT_387567 [Lentithecium fluviatile CBS 122367]